MAALETFVGIRMQPELRKLLWEVAVAKGQSMSTVARRAITNGLKFEQERDRR